MSVHALDWRRNCIGPENEFFNGIDPKRPVAFPKSGRSDSTKLPSVLMGECGEAGLRMLITALTVGPVAAGMPRAATSAP
jgi:hypothetical protein